MPRLSQADAELVVRCLERALEGKVDLSEETKQALSQVLARLKTRVEQTRVAAALPRDARSRRRSAQAPPRRPELTRGVTER